MSALHYEIYYPITVKRPESVIRMTTDDLGLSLYGKPVVLTRFAERITTSCEIVKINGKRRKRYFVLKRQRSAPGIYEAAGTLFIHPEMWAQIKERLT